MKRFIKKRTIGSAPGFMISIAVVLLVLLTVWCGVDSVAQTARKQQLDGVNRAIRRAAVHCYALEGYYPENLSYLETHYGLMLDDSRYRVHYSCFASNRMPDIDVFPLF